MNKKSIVLDCDGVLLDYSESYGRTYAKYSGKPISIINQHSYYCDEFYGIKWKNSADKESFFNFFNQEAWSSMIDIPKAIQATKILKQLNYHIIVVTSIPKEAESIRHSNLINLGFNIDETIATGAKISHDNNPKKPFLEMIKPNYFVDDLVENFHYLDIDDTHYALINHPFKDNPNNKLEQSFINSSHLSLYDFVKNIILKS